jgi:gas vesicle protein
MADDNNKFAYFFLGIGLGVAVGMLFAPQSGTETRDLLLSKADEGKQFIRKRGEDLRDSASDMVERGRTVVAQKRDDLSSAVDAGKQAYREAIKKVSDKPLISEGV